MNFGKNKIEYFALDEACNLTVILLKLKDFLKTKFMSKDSRVYGHLEFDKCPLLFYDMLFMLGEYQKNNLMICWYSIRLSKFNSYKYNLIL